MDIGIKIKRLRESRNITQPELSHRLGISQTTLCNIEIGDTKKIDFLLMDKICKEFDVDFDYFIEGRQVNNIEKNEGNIACAIGPTNNLIEQLKALIEDNKQKELKIKELESKLK